MKTATLLTLAATLLASAPALAKEGSLSQADQQFLTQSLKGDLAESDLGTLAASKGSTPAVREFARWMMSTHGFAGRELTTIAQKMHRETPPSKPEADAKTKELMGKLQNLKGLEFDKAYLQAIVQGHEQAAKMNEAEAKDGQDYLVKSFAANFAPTVKEHLAEAKLLMDAMNNQGASGGAEADANMKAAVGGVSGPAKGNDAQAKAVQKQHQ